MMNRAIFLEKNLQTLFDRNGYVVIDAFSPADMDQFELQYSQIRGKVETTFESTMNNTSSQHKREVHDLVTSYFKPLLEDYLHHFIPVTGNFVTKRPGKDGEVCPHQDWAITDEAHFRGINIWVPFVDTNEDNGAIYLVKGSHRLPPGKRGSHTPSCFDPMIFADYSDFTPVFMRRGQALIYDLRCIHASPPNVTDKARIAAGCACAPDEADLIHYAYEHEGSLLKTYKVSTDFFLQYAYMNSDVPEAFIPCSVQEDFKQDIYNCDIQTDLLNTQRIHGVSFIDGSIQKNYEKDGFVVVDCFNEKQVSEILAFFNQNSKWFKEGFLSSVYAPEMDYRIRVDQFLQPYAERILSHFFKDYKVIVSSFMAKGTGQGSEMYPHQDWSNVDETLYASFNIWIPLVDVNHANGSLYLMKGSHLLPFTFRGSNIPDALSDYSAFNSETLSYIPLKAGQAIIYDHRCIHYSPPNRSNRVRPACSINVAPKSARLFHYFYEKETDLLSCFEADKLFYFNHVIAQNSMPLNDTPIFKYHLGSFPKFAASKIDTLFKIQDVRKKNFFSFLPFFK